MKNLPRLYVKLPVEGGDNCGWKKPVGVDNQRGVETKIQIPVRSI